MATCGLARAGRTHHFSISSADGTHYGTLISQTMDLGSYDFQHSCSPIGPIPIIYPKDSAELVLLPFDGKYEKDMQLVAEIKCLLLASLRMQLVRASSWFSVAKLLCQFHCPECELKKLQSVLKSGVYMLSMFSYMYRPACTLGWVIDAFVLFPNKRTHYTRHRSFG